MNLGNVNVAAGGNGTPSKRRIMVVADPGRESAGALQWALSHAVLEHDELLLLHVEQLGSSLKKSSTFSSYFRRVATTASNNNNNNNNAGATFGSSSSMGENADGDFLEAMRAKCELMQPKVKVQIERVEMDGKDKAAAILSQSVSLGIDLLVIGQRRSSSILSKLGGAMSKDPAEFLIEHSKCLCVAVQKKGQNAGYLLNTKTHKNFWLLA